jgi:hypothetical protein
MKGEINEAFFCFADYFDLVGSICKDPCNNNGSTCHDSCKHLHRKHPTPEQYKEEYGEEYADHRPVWWRYADNNGIWRTKSYRAARGVPKNTIREDGIYPNVLIVCACTPWDRPSADWRPE